MTTTTELSNGYALLIGVERYADYDPSGKANLPAGWNDVLACWTLCRRLGLDPSRVHVLASGEPARQDQGITIDTRRLFDKRMNALVDEVKRNPRSFAEFKAKQQLLNNLWGDLVTHLKAPHPREEQVRRAEVNYLSKLKKGAVSQDAAHRMFAEWFHESPIRAAAVGETQAAPTRAAILREIEAMVEYGRKNRGAPLLITYSGHGARTSEGDLALCPEDVRRGVGELQGIIPFGTLREMLSDVEENVTILLDCCDAAAGGGEHEHSHGTSLATSSARVENAALTRFGGRVLAAAGRNQIAYQAVFGDRWHGAFTWAVTTALWQWKMKKQGAIAVDAVTWGHVLEQAAGLLRQLNYDQAPALLSRHGDVAHQRVFQVGSDLHAGGEAPTGKRRDAQLTPDWKYTIKNGTTVVAEVFVVKANVNFRFTTDHGPYKANVDSHLTVDEELWCVDAGAVAQLTGSISVDVVELVKTADGKSYVKAFESALGLLKQADVGSAAWGWIGPRASSKKLMHGEGKAGLELLIDAGNLSSVRWYQKGSETTIGAKSLQGTWTQTKWDAGPPTKEAGWTAKDSW